MRGSFYDDECIAFVVSCDAAWYSLRRLDFASKVCTVVTDGHAATEEFGRNNSASRLTPLLREFFQNL